MREVTKEMGDRQMANNNWNLDLDDDDDENEGNQNQQTSGPKDLRRALTKAQRENQELAKELREFRDAARRGTIEKIVADKKLNPKIAGLIPADLDAKPEAIGQWLDTYADLFSPQAAPADNGESEQEEDPYVFERQSYARRDRVEANSPLPDRNTDLLARVQSAQTPEALLELVTKHGGGYGRG